MFHCHRVSTCVVAAVNHDRSRFTASSLRCPMNGMACSSLCLNIWTKAATVKQKNTFWRSFSDFRINLFHVNQECEILISPSNSNLTLLRISWMLHISWEIMPRRSFLLHFAANIYMLVCVEMPGRKPQTQTPILLSRLVVIRFSERLTTSGCRCV